MNFKKMGPDSVMVVEDDEILRMSVMMLLETEKFQVVGAENGNKALKLLEERGLPQLILLDMRMPVMNGWDFAVELRKRYSREVPIMVMTAAEDVKKRAEDISAEGWIGKPFELDALISRVRSFVKREKVA